MRAAARAAVALALLALLALAGCGFRPLYGEAAPGRALAGAVRVEDVEGRLGYVFRQSLRERIGDPAPAAPYVLTTELEFEETGLAISPTDDVTRYDVQGAAAYVVRNTATGEVVAEGEVRSLSAYSTLASPYATRIARRDARGRVAENLADRVFARLVALAAAE